MSAPVKLRYKVLIGTCPSVINSFSQRNDGDQRGGRQCGAVEPWPWCWWLWTQPCYAGGQCFQLTVFNNMAKALLPLTSSNLVSLSASWLQTRKSWAPACLRQIVLSHMPSLHVFQPEWIHFRRTGWLMTTTTKRQKGWKWNRASHQRSSPAKLSTLGEMGGNHFGHNSHSTGTFYLNLM